MSWSNLASPGRRLFVVLTVAMLVLASTAVVLAVTNPDPGPFVGCLATKSSKSANTVKGVVYNVAKGTTPLYPCLAGDPSVTFGGGVGTQGQPGPSGEPGASGEPGQNGLSQGWTTISPPNYVLAPNADTHPVPHVVMQVQPIDPQPNYLMVVARTTMTADTDGTLPGNIDCQIQTSNFADFNGGYSNDQVILHPVQGSKTELSLTALLPGLTRVGIVCLRFDQDGPTLTFSNIELTAAGLDAGSAP